MQIMLTWLNKDQKWRNMKLQGQNLIFFLQGLKSKFNNITETKNSINPKKNTKN